MTAFLILLGLLVGTAIGGTVLLVMRDGYGRRPVRPGTPRAEAGPVTDQERTTRRTPARCAAVARRQRAL